MLQKFVVWESVVQAYYVKGYQPASQTHSSDPFLYSSTLWSNCWQTEEISHCCAAP